LFLAFKWLNLIFAEFPTSRLEMNVVANIFDRCGESYINWKEFLAALRSDGSKRSEFLAHTTGICKQIERVNYLMQIKNLAREIPPKAQHLASKTIR
jgi:hypothetical protein